MNENGHTKIGHYIQEASLYVFSVVTEILPTYVQWNSSIGKMERLMREWNYKADIGGARWLEEGLLRVIWLKCAKITNAEAWKEAMKFQPGIGEDEISLQKGGLMSIPDQM